MVGSQEERAPPPPLLNIASSTAAVASAPSSSAPALPQLTAYPPPSPLYYGSFSPYPYAIPSPVPHPLQHFYATAAQAYPVMSPLAFPVIPPPSNNPPQAASQQPSQQRQMAGIGVAPSPLPGGAVDDYLAAAPPVFVFPPVSDTDRQPSPFGSDGYGSGCGQEGCVVVGCGSGSSSSSGSDGCGNSSGVGGGSTSSSAASSRAVSPVIGVADYPPYLTQHYFQAPQQQQQQHQQISAAIECATPTMPVLSPLISPYLSHSMTPTFAYDSYGLYQHPGDYYGGEAGRGYTQQYAAVAQPNYTVTSQPQQHYATTAPQAQQRQQQETQQRMQEVRHYALAATGESRDMNHEKTTEIRCHCCHEGSKIVGGSVTKIKEFGLGSVPEIKDPLSALVNDEDAVSSTRD